MLWLEIQTDIYKLHSDPKRYRDLKFELLSKYKESDMVTCRDKEGKIIEVLELADLFDTRNNES